MHAINIDVRYRPIKVGWCIKKQDLTSLKEALELTSILWGGFFNPIIPIDEPTLAESLINAFKIDVLLPIVPDEETLAFIKKYNYIGNEFLSGEFYTTYGYADEQFLKIIDIWHVISDLCEQYEADSERGEEFVFYQWNDEDPLSNIFLSTFGRIPNKRFFSNYNIIIKKDLKSKVVTIKKNRLFPKDSMELPALEFISGSSLSSENITNYTKSGLYVGYADDCAYSGENEHRFWANVNT